MTKRSATPPTDGWTRLAGPGMYERRWSDGSHAAYADPTIAREHRLLGQNLLSAQAEQLASETLAELRAGLHDTNPLAFYVQIESWSRVLRHLPIEKVYGYDALVEFAGESSPQCPPKK